MNTMTKRIDKNIDSEPMELIEEWVYAYQARIRSYLFSRTGDEAVSRDLAQEVFLVAMRQMDQFDTAKEPWSWLMGIAHNKLREHWRGVTRRSNVLEAFVAQKQLDEDEVDAENLKKERKDALEHCLETLQPKARSLVEMVYVKHLSCAQVAERLQQKAGSVRIAIHRVRKILRSCVDSRALGGQV